MVSIDLICMLVSALLCASVVTGSKADIRATNVGGWLLIEEWMFSNGMFDKVAELRDEPQGVILPPQLPNGYGGKYFCEGDLINQLNNRFGSARAVEILEAHRESYITADDFSDMAARGIKLVRLPLGWWAFCNESASGAPATLIGDPYHQDRKFVSISYAFLTKTLQSIADAGLTVLIDVHAMPGGSADGSYNGVFPNEPMFFKQIELMQMGDQILANMFAFYNNLAPELKNSVTGFTLLNEPAHMVPDDAQTMLSWLGSAADAYRTAVVSPCQAANIPVPLLYVNLIATSVPEPEMLDFMVETFSSAELASWAVLDIHVYYAWDGSRAGCTDWADGCAFQCSLDVEDPDAFAVMGEQMAAAAAGTHAYFAANGSVPLLACSEFSLATYHDSNNACRGRDWLDLMYHAQADGFAAQGIADRAVFWTWKMPYGGSHEAGWSLQSYLRGT